MLSNELVQQNESTLQIFVVQLALWEVESQPLTNAVPCAQSEWLHVPLVVVLHVPPPQNWRFAQTFPHEPQLEVSDCVLTHLPLQSVWPCWQEAAQTPFWHD